MMIPRMLLVCVLAMLFAPTGYAETWSAVTDTGRSEADPNVIYLRREIRSASGKAGAMHLVFFSSKDCKLEVIDLGADGSKYGSHVEAFRSHGCIAGVNGGFFQADFRPIGLMIAGGNRTGAFANSGFLSSGVISSDADGIDLLRRAGFRDRPGIDALLQAGPYLVEQGSPVQGLDNTKSRRRTAVLTDWRRNWAIVSTSSLTLAELADVLASPQVLKEWPVNRAVNLDGGTSCSFYFDGLPSSSDVTISSWKPVRNLLGIKPR